VTAPASRRGRRRLLAVVALAAAALLLAAPSSARDRRWTVAFANLTEDPGVTLEGTAFTGAEVREGFRLAARALPIDLVFYDNRGDAATTLANVEDAVTRKVDLYIQYGADAATNSTVAQRLGAAGIPVLAINYPVPGAPLYTADNTAAGRIAGEALARFATRTWRGEPVAAAVLGALGDESRHGPERARGVAAGLARTLPAVTPVRLDTRGNPAQIPPLLGRFLGAHAGRKVLVAALDDPTALAAKEVIERAGRTADAAIVSHGADPTVRGGAAEKKEIHPDNRGSILIGSVALFLDRYGYEVLPLALRVLRGEPVPPRTMVRHLLVTPSNVFAEYPPSDMN
jgi:ABC-type sugar transport system substrate-binding protein